MKRLILAGCAVIALSACQREADADPNVETEAAEDAASEASATASASDSGDYGRSGEASDAGMGAAPDASGDPVGAPPPINGTSGAAPAEAGGSVRPELGSRPPEDPTTGTLARPETPMPQTTPDGRPAL